MENQTEPRKETTSPFVTANPNSSNAKPVAQRPSPEFGASSKAAAKVNTFVVENDEDELVTKIRQRAVANVLRSITNIEEEL